MDKLEYYDYETIEGDTFDMISLDFYDDEIYAADIMNFNPRYIGILVFPQGIKLQIPIIEIAEESNLPPWKVG